MSGRRFCKKRFYMMKFFYYPIILFNLYPPKLCKRTRLRVTGLMNIMVPTIITGSGTGESVFIPRISVIPNNYPFETKRIQFPVSICLAMTINTSRGQTLKAAGIDLLTNCFSHGQLYVAVVGLGGLRVTCSSRDPRFAG